MSESRKNTLIVLCGLPASGKSTFAEMLEESGFKVVCPDRVRKLLYGNESIQGNGKDVFRYAFESMILYGGELNKDVVFDATNTTKKARKKILELARPHFDFILCYHFNVHPLICLKRNEGRERVVPEEVICRMAKQFQEPSTEEGFDYVCQIGNYYY